MKVTKGMKRLCVFLVLSLYSIGMTLACITWMIEDTRNKELSIQKSIEILVLEQEIKLLKQELRLARNIDEKPVIKFNVESDTRVDQKLTTYKTAKAFVHSKLNGLSDYISIDDFYLLSEKYAVDPGFALATFILETGWGKSDAWLNQNNPAGLTCGEKYCTFKTKSQGVEEMFSLMSSYVQGTYSWIGTRRTIVAIRQKWSTTEDTDVIVKLWNQILNY